MLQVYPNIPRRNAGISNMNLASSQQVSTGSTNFRTHGVFIDPTLVAYIKLRCALYIFATLSAIMSCLRYLFVSKEK